MSDSGRLHAVFLIRSLNEGGAQRQLLALLKGLQAKKGRLSVVCLYSGGLFWERIARLEGVRLVSLGKSGRWDIPAVALRLWRYARRERPDVVHGYMTAGNLMASFVRLALPSARLIWGVRTSNVHLKNFDAFDKSLFWLETRLSCSVDAVIFNSESGRSSYGLAGFKARSMQVIPNGIDVSYFRRDPEGGFQVRRSLGIDNRDTLFGHVGRLDPVKDHPLFLRTAARLLRVPGVVNVRFLCVTAGSASYLKSLKGLASSLGLEGRVHWVQDVSEMRPYYSAMDVMTSTSYVEGFPNVLCEAMACEVPCVATDCGDNAEILGDPSFLVPVRNEEALLSAWQRILLADRRALGLRARAVISEKYSVDRMVDATWNTILGNTVS